MARRSVTFVLALAAATLAPLLVPAPSGASPNPAAAVGPASTLGGEHCNLVKVPAAGTSPVGLGTCPGVRPGAIVRTKVGLCTMNFLFRAPDGERFIGTAGHCILGTDPTGGDVGEQSWTKGRGPEAKDVDNKRIGEFAYAVLKDPKDFSLIRLDPGVEASPEMCHFGGPTGINNDINGKTTVLEYFGEGVGIGRALPARSAVAFGLSDPNHVYANGLVVPGDSGSGVISEDGRAVGLVVTLGVHGFGVGPDGIDAGTIGITRIGPQIARAEQVLHTTLTLVTARA